MTPGYATITALLNDSKAKFSILVNESGYDLDFDYSKKLTQDMIYSNRNILSNNTANPLTMLIFNKMCSH